MFPSIYKPSPPSALLANSPLVLTSPPISETSSPKAIQLRNKRMFMPLTEEELDDLCDGAIEQNDFLSTQVRPSTVPRLNIDSMLRRRKEAAERKKQEK